MNHNKPNGRKNECRTENAQKNQLIQTRKMKQRKKNTKLINKNCDYFILSLGRLQLKD